MMCAEIATSGQAGILHYSIEARQKTHEFWNFLAACSILWRWGMLTVPGKRFTELQDEFFETSKHLRLARTPEEKLELLNELQRIVKESKRALAEPDSKKSK
jgi:hypothetical protein